MVYWIVDRFKLFLILWQAMRRKKQIIANWKMHKTIHEGVDFVHQLNSLPKEREVKIAPPFTALALLAKETSIPLGGQNVATESQGPYTGEVSARMLEEAGASFVLIGHSERRNLFHESDSVIHQKIACVLKTTQLRIVLCVGESEEERRKGVWKEVIQRQLEVALYGIEEHHRIDVAYEPVWAIGTGKIAVLEEIIKVHRYCKESIQKDIAMIYGGSVKPENAQALLEQESIDGLLVGGSSLEVASFNAIIYAGIR